MPRIQVILRKAYGGAYVAMDSRSAGCDLSFAWPDNEIAVMGAEGAVDVLFRRRIAASDDPGGLRQQLIAEYELTTMDPGYAVAAGLVDRIIEPRRPATFCSSRWTSWSPRRASSHAATRESARVSMDSVISAAC